MAWNPVAGAAASGTGGVTPGLPSGWAEGWLLLLVINSWYEDESAASVPAGWTLIDTVANGHISTTPAVRQSLYYKYAEAGETAPSIPDAGNYTHAVIIGIPASEVASTNPIEGSATSSPEYGSTGLSIGGVASASADALIVASVCIGDDSITSSNWANSSLDSITELVDASSTDGKDSGIKVAYGNLTSAGASGTTTFDLSGGEYVAAITVAIAPAGGAGSQAITGSDHVDGDTFGAGTVVPGAVQITGVSFSDGDTFGSGAVVPGAVQITGTMHLDPDDFGAGAVVPGSVQITGTMHLDPDTFGAGVVSAESVLQPIGGQAHVDPDSFGAGLIQVGSVQISGTAYVDPDSFGAGVVSVEGGPQAIGGQAHDDPDAFGAGAVVPGAVTIGGAAHEDGDTFGAGAISVRIVGTVYVDADQFGAGQIQPGGVIITGTAFVDPDQFGSGWIGDPASLLVVPDERVAVLPRELRAVSLLSEPRTILLPAERRVVAIERI